jgi:opacity protein-like surface antigen
MFGAHAGRPLATEDAGVLERGECEWESFAARAKESQGSAGKTLSTQLGCGIGANTQVAFAVQRESADGQHAHALVLGGKTSLVEGKDESPSLALAWGIHAVRPPGATMKHDGTALNLVLSHELAKALTGHANLGWVRSQSTQRTAMTWNLAAEHALGHGVDVMAEYYGEQRDKPWVGVGVRLAVTDKLSFDASYSVQSGPAKTQLLTLGAKLAF